MNEIHDEKKLDWMYKGANSLIDREDYLLGRSVDKTLEQINAEEKEKKLGLVPPKNHVEHECIPPSIRDFNKIVQAEQVDISAKLQEDPLVAIKKREEEARRQFLQNPVQLKKLQEALRAQELKNRKKHKKLRGYESDSDLDRKITKKLIYLKDGAMDVAPSAVQRKKAKGSVLDTILMHKFNELKDKLSQEDLNDILAGNVSDTDDENKKKSKKRKKRRKSLSESSDQGKKKLKTKSTRKRSSSSSGDEERPSSKAGKRSPSSDKKVEKYRRHKIESDKSFTRKYNRESSSEKYGNKPKVDYRGSENVDRSRKKEESGDESRDKVKRTHKKKESADRRKRRDSSSDNERRKVKRTRERKKSLERRKRRDSSTDDNRRQESDNEKRGNVNRTNEKRELTERRKRRDTSSDDNRRKESVDERRGKVKRTHEKKAEVERRKRRDNSTDDNRKDIDYEENKRTRIDKYKNSADSELEIKILQKLRMLRDSVKSTIGKSNSSTSDSSSSSDDSSADSEKKSKTEKSTSSNNNKNKKKTHEKKKESSTSSSDDSSSEESHQKLVPQYDSDNDEHVYKQRAFGLVKSDGTKIALNKKLVQVKKVPKPSKVETITKTDRKQVKKLTEEEKDKLRREMMKNAEQRDKERSENLRKYREEDKIEEEKRKSGNFDKEFVHKQLLKTTKDATVETRIKSNLNNIQRSSRHMDSHFSRRN